MSKKKSPKVVETNDYEIITLDLPTDVISSLAIAAHNRDMKLNDFLVEIILADASRVITANE